MERHVVRHASIFGCVDFFNKDALYNSTHDTRNKNLESLPNRSYILNFINCDYCRYGALSFWDYASGAPYQQIDINPVGWPDKWKDAVFFSGHKFIGGVSSPGETKLV